MLKTSNKIRCFFIFFGILLCVITKGFTQNGFFLPHYVKSDKISFKLINNLVVIPVELNGTHLTFLLDTGVNSTIIFSLFEEDSLKLNNARFIKLRGLGEGGSISALKSDKNILKIGKAIDVNHSLYVIYDDSFNLSTRMGIPIHGIVGYEYFKNFIIKTNYITKKITTYNPRNYNQKKCKKCQTFDLIIKENKPFIKLDITSHDKIEEVILLIDSGSSDSIWLFDQKGYIDENNKNYFEDFLGQGLSGDIFGKRSILTKIKIGEFVLNEVKVAFPDKKFLRNTNFFKARNGSIGAEILKRFTVLIDYPSQKITLKKNSYFKDPFNYNMSGLTLEHDGVILVKDKQQGGFNNSLNINQSNENNGVVKIPLRTVYNFYLAPRYIVAAIRENSPAALAGIKKGDEIISVNGKKTYRYKLQELIGLFSSNVGKKIYMNVGTNGVISRRKFTLKKVF